MTAEINPIYQQVSEHCAAHIPTAVLADEQVMKAVLELVAAKERRVQQLLSDTAPAYGDKVKNLELTLKHYLTKHPSYGVPEIAAPQYTHCISKYLTTYFLDLNTQTDALPETPAPAVETLPKIRSNTFAKLYSSLIASDDPRVSQIRKVFLLDSNVSMWIKMLMHDEVNHTMEPALKQHVCDDLTSRFKCLLEHSNFPGNSGETAALYCSSVVGFVKDKMRDVVIDRKTSGEKATPRSNNPQKAKALEANFSMLMHHIDPDRTLTKGGVNAWLERLSARTNDRNGIAGP